MSAIVIKGNKNKSASAAQAMNRALKYLGYRPRSTAEIKAKLKQCGYAEGTITQTVNRLKNTGLIDDRSFATRWKESRQNNSPRSARLIAQELRQKGISPKIISEVTLDIDDEAEAYRAALKKSLPSRVIDIDQFRKKMSVFLRQRGFDYEVIQTVTERLWQDKFEEAVNE